MAIMKEGGKSHGMLFVVSPIDTWLPYLELAPLSTVDLLY